MASDMKLTQIDLNLFVVFDMIYSERNLTRAAERLAVTQPTVSNALARLRRTYGDPLFVKTSQGMQPTAFAQSIAGHVSDALRLLTTSAQGPAQFDPAHSTRVFRTSMLELFDAMALPVLIPTLARLAPHVELHSYRVSRGELAGALERGAVDLAVEIPLADTRNLIFETILHESYVCAVRPDHPMVGQDMTLDRYLDLEHIHVSGRPRGVGAEDAALRRIGKRRIIRARLQSHLALADIIRQSDMAVTLTQSRARALGLAVFPVPFDIQPLELRLYRHVRSDGDAAVLWLYDQIKNLGAGSARRV